MIAKLRYILPLLVAGLPLPALSTQTQAEPPKEAVGLLKLKGYQDFEALNCSGSIYRFGVSRSGDQL
jgi:hypothetical protein